MIKNLEVYGLDPAAVATALQHRAQASSILQPIPGSKDKVLVQIQGNQIHQVGTMLLGLWPQVITEALQSPSLCLFPRSKTNTLSLFISDHYKLPRKYIQGLEKAPKGGKKK